MVIPWSSLSEMPRTIRYYHWGSWRHRFKKRKLRPLVHRMPYYKHKAISKSRFIRCPQCDECSLTPFSIWCKGFCSHFMHCQVSSTLQILEDIGNYCDPIHLKNFNKSAEIIEKNEISSPMLPILNEIILIHINNSTKKSCNHLLLHWKKKWKTRST